MIGKTLTSSLALTAMAVIGAAACTPLDEPRAACADSRAVAALYTVFAGNAFAENRVDRRGISKLVAFNEIAFERYSRTNGHLECRGVITFKAPQYKGFGDKSGAFTFSRDPSAKGDGFDYRMDPFPPDTAQKARAWSELVKPPVLPRDFRGIARWRVVAAIPARVGDCTLTRIEKKSTRIQEQVGHRYEEVAGSGSAIVFKNGIYQVSHNTLPAVESSVVGDRIKLCLIQVPLDCPQGDERGKVYSALDLRTGYHWFLPDSEHICGGA